jgi:predicted nucleic acid-binding protein
VLVLVDSSAWIEFFLHFRHDPTHPLQRLGEEQRLATNWVIRVEVLTGMRDAAAYAQLDQELGALHQLPLNEGVWVKAARLRWELRCRGIQASVPDVVVATCAMEYDCELFHCDHHFDLIAKHAPLKLFRPSHGRT